MKLPPTHTRLAFCIALAIYGVPCFFLLRLEGLSQIHIAKQAQTPIALYHFQSESSAPESKPNTAHSSIQPTKHKPTPRKAAKQNLPTHQESARTDSVLNTPQALGGGESDEYAQRIYGLILRSYEYPARLAYRGVRGEVGLRFCIDENGWLKTAEIATGSGSEALDRLALSTLKRAAKSFPPPPTQERYMSIVLGYGMR